MEFTELEISFGSDYCNSVGEIKSVNNITPFNQTNKKNMFLVIYKKLKLYFITTSLITFSPNASFTLSIIFSF